MKRLWCEFRGWCKRSWFYIETGRHVDRWDGHDWERWRDKPVRTRGVYNNTLYARCRRCGLSVSEHRWGYAEHSGSLTYIRGGYAP